MFLGIDRLGDLAGKLRLKHLAECFPGCSSERIDSCDCGACEVRSPDEVQRLLLIYATLNLRLDARFDPRPGTVETTAARVIDDRPCEPIEPDTSPVCVTEDDLT